MLVDVGAVGQQPFFEVVLLPPLLKWVFAPELELKLLVLLLRHINSEEAQLPNFPDGLQLDLSVFEVVQQLLLPLIIFLVFTIFFDDLEHRI